LLLVAGVDDVVERIDDPVHCGHRIVDPDRIATAGW
jgi:hypothetical protein